MSDDEELRRKYGVLMNEPQFAAYVRQLSPPPTSSFPYPPPNHPADTPTVPWVLTDTDRALLGKFKLSGE
jgi:hypothetical protein